MGFNKNGHWTHFRASRFVDVMRQLPSGIYAPVLPFFRYDSAESVDYDGCARHAVSLVRAGVRGLVVHGFAGEAAGLTLDEREGILRAIRGSVDGCDTVIVAGIGGQCLQESLSLARSAARAGADYGLALPPSFFAGLFDEEALTKYFVELADGSPIPFIIYNCPQVTNGINLSSRFLCGASRHPQIIGAQLACGSVGKIQHLHPDGGNLQGTFQVLVESAAFLAAARTAGAVGAIISLSNVFPYTLVKLYNLIESGASETEVLRLQSLVTNYEEIMTTASVPGIRATMGLLGLPAGHSRKPLPDASPAEIDHLKRHIVDIAAEENRLRELVQAASEGNE